jgi:hypothetical protein
VVKYQRVSREEGSRRLCGGGMQRLGISPSMAVFVAVVVGGGG